MILKIAIKQILSRPVTLIGTLAAMTISLTLLGSFWTLVENLNRVQVSGAAQMNNSSEILVFAQSGLSENQLRQTSKSLSRLRQVRRVEKIDAQEAVAKFKEEFGEALTKTLSPETLPSAFKIILRSNQMQAADLAKLNQDLKGIAGVLDTQISSASFGGSQEAAGMPKRIVDWATVLLIAVFAVVVLLISHLVRLVFENNKNEIETMKIVGASSSWIFYPILLESLFLGGAGLILSLATLFFSVKKLLPLLTSALLPSGTEVLFISSDALLKISAVTICASLAGALLTWPLVARRVQLK